MLARLWKRNRAAAVLLVGLDLHVLLNLNGAAMSCLFPMAWAVPIHTETPLPQVAIKAMHRIISDLRVQSSLEGTWSLYSSAKGGTRKSVGRGLDGHYPQWQQISFWCSTTLPIFNSSSLTRGARSPDTQHWWNVFPTGQSKRNGMKIWEHWALPPKEPSCQMTNIIDCNFLTFLCGDWVDRYSTFIILYPGTLETCFRRIGPGCEHYY